MSSFIPHGKAQLKVDQRQGGNRKQNILEQASDLESTSENRRKCVTCWTRRFPRAGSRFVLKEDYIHLIFFSITIVIIITIIIILHVFLCLYRDKTNCKVCQRARMPPGSELPCALYLSPNGKTFRFWKYSNLSLLKLYHLGILMKCAQD